jgi:[ribosomal protein S5]-alanine N-acetyltransferase
MQILQQKKQLLLRPFERSEVGYYSEWMRSPEILGPFVEAEHKSAEEILADFDKDGWRSNKMRRWLLTNIDGTIMGFAHCWEFDPFETHVEFGRILLPEYRGKGWGAPFLSLVIDHVFAETDAHRAQSVTACGNIAVQRNWERVGLMTEARLREYMMLNGSYVDCFLCSVLRREWQNAGTTQ